MSFGVSAVFLYASSATYHALQIPWEQLRYLLLLDVCAIFVLIAGTYTPIVLLIVPAGLEAARDFFRWSGLWRPQESHIES